MAIKDLHFNGCYLVDVPTLHIPVDEMISRIKVRLVTDGKNHLNCLLTSKILCLKMSS